VNIRLTSELRSQLQRLAEADSRKLSAYIELVLRGHVKSQLEAPSEPDKTKKR
jgi:predicted transcriptional regulator